MNLPSFFSVPTQDLIFPSVYLPSLHLRRKGKKRTCTDFSLEAAASLLGQPSLPGCREGTSHCHLLAQEYDRKNPYRKQPQQYFHKAVRISCFQYSVLAEHYWLCPSAARSAKRQGNKNKLFLAPPSSPRKTCLLLPYPRKCLCFWFLPDGFLLAGVLLLPVFWAAILPQPQGAAVQGCPMGRYTVGGWSQGGGPHRPGQGPAAPEQGGQSRY